MTPKVFTVVQIMGFENLVGLQYIDKKRNCQPDLVDAQNTIIWLNKWLKTNDLINL